MRVYIAGPMSMFSTSGYNYDAFDDCEQSLRNLGFDPLSPANFFNRQKKLDNNNYMKAGYAALLRSDMVAMLDKWEQSNGACSEALFALQCGIPVVEAYTFAPICKEQILEAAQKNITQQLGQTTITEVIAWVE